MVSQGHESLPFWMNSVFLSRMDELLPDWAVMKRGPIQTLHVLIGYSNSIAVLQAGWTSGTVLTQCSDP